MTPADTSHDVAEQHTSVYQKLGIDGRFRIALELSDLTHTLAAAGMRRGGGDISEEEARRRVAEVLYGSFVRPEQ
jgi:hypothetical protein